MKKQCIKMLAILLCCTNITHMYADRSERKFRDECFYGENPEDCYRRLKNQEEFRHIRDNIEEEKRCKGGPTYYYEKRYLAQFTAYLLLMILGFFGFRSYQSSSHRDDKK